jgi:ubiquinone/menaquinone biosynthesis C-methylase UbiE
MAHVHTRGSVVHWARGYDLLVWLLLLGRETAFRERLARLARFQPGESVLDIGCGTGTQAIIAKRHVGAGAVHGLDAGVEMIVRARHKAAKANADVTFTEGVVEQLPYPDHHFDVVLSVMMLHHLPRDVRAMCADEVKRVLRPGGRVLAVDFGGTKGLIAHVHGHAGLDIRKISELLGNAGLHVNESGSVGVPGVNYVLAGN